MYIKHHRNLEKFYACLIFNAYVTDRKTLVYCKAFDVKTVREVTLNFDTCPFFLSPSFPHIKPKGDITVYLSLVSGFISIIFLSQKYNLPCKSPQRPSELTNLRTKSVLKRDGSLFGYDNVIHSLLLVVLIGKVYLALHFIFKEQNELIDLCSSFVQWTVRREFLCLLNVWRTTF